MSGSDSSSAPPSSAGRQPSEGSSSSLPSSTTTHMDRLLSDMKMLAAYEAAGDWQEPKAMEAAFNNFSWSDSEVLKALPEYLASKGEQKRRVDFAYTALCPRPVDAKDPKQTLMTLWLKARLFSYDQKHPFNLSPYATDLSYSKSAAASSSPSS